MNPIPQPTKNDDKKLTETEKRVADAGGTIANST